MTTQTRSRRQSAVKNNKTVNRYTKQSILDTYINIFGNIAVPRSEYRHVCSISDNTITRHFGSYTKFMNRVKRS